MRQKVKLTQIPQHISTVRAKNIATKVRSVYALPSCIQYICGFENAISLSLRILCGPHKSKLVKCLCGSSRSLPFIRLVSVRSKDNTRRNLRHQLRQNNRHTHRHYPVPDFAKVGVSGTLASLLRQRWEQVKLKRSYLPPVLRLLYWLCGRRSSEPLSRHWQSIT